MVQLGDCLEVMAAMPAGSVDAVVTDPPYGLGQEPDVAEVLSHWLAGDDYQHRGGGFMGKTWDSFVPGPSYWRAALGALRPGGYLLAFGGTRTVDLLTIALRLGGFEIRDCLVWLYGSGFPKSRDVSKAIDEAAGATREVIGQPERSDLRAGGAGFRNLPGLADEQRGPIDLTAPATVEAERWAGWGTALKPAHEPIVVARKPLIGTVHANVLEHGTGALNIDGCRLPIGDVDAYARNHSGDRGHDGTRTADEKGATDLRPGGGSAAEGRWPANVALDEEAAAMLDEQADARGDPGGPSRFFYVAKASRAERNAGLDGFDKRPILWSSGEQSPGTFQAEGTERAARNNHPTVKPVALMRWLARLVTQPDGLILDPFAGSGTTGIAAALEGFRFHGIEREPDYARIADARIAFWAEHGEEALGIVAEQERAETAREFVREAGQLELL